MPRHLPEPPDYDHVWLTVEHVAERLELTRQAVTKAAREGRLPATWYADRWWFRRDLLEMTVAARARKKPAPPPA